MLVHVSTNNHLAGESQLADKVAENVKDKLKRFEGQITRIEVFIHDDNAEKSGAADKRCIMEARVAGIDPIAVSHQAPEVSDAVKGSIDKLMKSLDRTLEKLRHPTKGVNRV